MDETSQQHTHIILAYTFIFIMRTIWHQRFYAHTYLSTTTPTDLEAYQIYHLDYTVRVFFVCSILAYSFILFWIVHHLFQSHFIAIHLDCLIYIFTHHMWYESHLVAFNTHSRVPCVCVALCFSVCTLNSLRKIHSWDLVNSRLKTRKRAKHQNKGDMWCPNMWQIIHLYGCLVKIKAFS